MTQKQQARYEQTLSKLQERTGSGTQLVSLYIPPDKNINSVRQQMATEESEAQNIKSKQTRKNVQKALASIQNELKNYQKTPENGLVVFSGETDKGFDTVVFEPDTPVSSYQYHCDSSFLLEPLVAAMDTENKYLLVVIDKGEAQIGVLDGSRVEVVAEVTMHIPSKHSKGGQSQQRFRRIRTEKIDKFYKKVAKQVNNEFHNRDIEGVLVGGPSHTRKEFLNYPEIDTRVSDSIISEVSIGDTTMNGLNELLSKSEDALEAASLNEQKELIERFFKRLRTDPTKVTYGLIKVFEAIRLGSVDYVLVSDAKKHEEIEVLRCENDHIHVPDEKFDQCPDCSEQVKKEQKPLFEVVEEVSGRFGTNVKYISDGFEGGEQLLQAFDGIAALLRFSIFQ